MKGFVFAILFLSLLVSSDLVAQTVSASPHVTNFVEIRYQNYDNNAQNNIPETIKYDYRMHFKGSFVVSSLDNVGKFKVVIGRGNMQAAYYNPAFTGLETEIYLVREGGKVMYQIEGVKREVKNNVIHYDAYFLGDIFLFSIYANVQVVIDAQVYGMNDNLISTTRLSAPTYNGLANSGYSYLRFLN